MADAALKPMTIDAFFDWCPKDDDRHWQLIDGQPMAMAPPSRAHRIIATNLLVGLMSALRTRPGCIAEQAAGVVPDSREGSYYEADIVVSSSHPEFGERHTPAPIFIVEILSASTMKIDRTIKLEDYRRIPTVREIVLVDQDRPHVEVHRRLADGEWALHLVTGLDAKLVLISVGLETDLAAVYGNVPLPGGNHGGTQ